MNWQKLWKVAGHDGGLSIEHQDVLFNSIEVLKMPVALLQRLMPIAPSGYPRQEI